MKTSEFKEHSIFEKLGLLESTLASKVNAEKIDLESLDFFKASSSYIRTQLDKALTSLINIADLSATSSEIEAAIGQINTFIGNNNTGHLTNAANNLFAAISKARNFPTPNHEGGFSYSQVINDFKSLVDQKIDALAISIDEREEELESLKTELDEKEKELDKISKKIIEKQTIVDGLNTTFQTNFDQIKTTESTRFEEVRSGFQKQIDTELKRIDTNTKELIERLDKKETEAKKLVNIIGNIGATGNYQRIAEAHKRTADFWRYTAAGFMALLSLILLITIWKIDLETFNWQISLIRILSALVLTYPATYAAKESNKHRKLENQNRKAELELASINSFIEILDDTKKQEIKEKLVEKYFGNKDGFGESDADKSDDISMNVLEKLVKLINEIKSK